LKKQSILLLALILNTTIAYAQTTTTPQNLILNLYRDGSTQIEYTLQTNPTKPRTNITLIGYTYQNLIITDENNLPITWKTTPTGIQTDTLGSKTVTITYETYSLTNKTANQWTITITTPINTIITLPKNAVLTKLEPTPISITTDQDQVTLTQPNGTTTISYMLGTIGTRERAIILLNKAESAISQAQEEGIKVPEAETLLVEAQKAYNEKDYSRSEQISSNTIMLTEETLQKAIEAQSAIESTTTLLEQSSENLAPESLTNANNKLDSANKAYIEGNYEEAALQAEEASQIIATGAQETGSSFPTMIIGGAVIAVILIIVLSKALSNRGVQASTSEPIKERIQIDLDALFKENTYLRTDEKAVLRYIHESGGAFVTEIRERFDIPKSSTWRMIKRLEEYELISIETVGRESHVNIRRSQ
jgi:uncharacterized membrane protein